jgi:hypothetical protein
MNWSTYCSLSGRSKQSAITALEWVTAFALAAQAIGPCHAEPLSAGIQSNTIQAEATPAILQGQVFDERNLPPLHTKRCWYEIPAWFAGTWHRDSEQRKMLFMQLSLQSRRDRIRGYQADAFGRIWHACDEPSLVVVDQARSVEYKLILSIEPVRVSADSVTIRFVDRSITVDKISGRVVRIYDQDMLQESTPCGPGLVHTKATEGGKIAGTFDEHLIQAFSPIDQDDHRNYYLEFCEHLSRAGHPEAIPRKTAAQGE